MDPMHMQTIELARLRAAATAQGLDARIWRWYSDQVEERTVECRYLSDAWSIRIAGRELARDGSFEVAIRSAYALSRAMAVF